MLAAQGRVVLDGALATELERRGADLNDPLWSARLLIEAPEMIAQLHRDYFDAGADVATTASYQASFEGFARRGIDAEGAADLMRRAVALAVQARDAWWADPAHRAGRLRPLVAASVGPYGAMRADGSEYHGYPGVDEATLAAFHRPRLAVLAEAGADLLACETLPCVAEALVLARLLAEWPHCRAWISFSCRDGAHTCQGDAFGDAVAALDDCPQVVAVGINCTAPAHVPALLAAAQGRTRKPLLVYPNSGEQYDAADKRWLGCADHRPFAEQAAGWTAAGARLVGGCCRTAPGDIAALRRRLLGPAGAEADGQGPSAHQEGAGRSL